MGANQQDIELAEHDTVDLQEEVGDIDAVLATGSLAVAAESRRAGIVELFLVGIANTIWGIVGLVLWLPQALRAVLSAVVRVIHSALTNQRSDRAVAGIKQVSRLYTDRFLRRSGEPVFVGRRHELRPFRLIAEATWVCGFYLLVLRWLAPSLFQTTWERLTAWWSVVAGWLATVGARLEELPAGRSPELTPSGWQAGGALLAMVVVGALVGFWLGRRRR